MATCSPSCAVADDGLATEELVVEEGGWSSTGVVSRVGVAEV